MLSYCWFVRNSFVPSLVLEDAFLDVVACLETASGLTVIVGLQLSPTTYTHLIVKLQSANHPNCVHEAVLIAYMRPSIGRGRGVISRLKLNVATSEVGERWSIIKRCRPAANYIHEMVVVATGRYHHKVSHYTRRIATRTSEVS